MRIFVGNLPYSTTDLELREVFQQFGQVNDCKVITDRETARSKGFAFVMMHDAAGAEAINALDQSDLGGRRIQVSVARERSQRSGSEPRPVAETIKQGNRRDKTDYGW